MGKKGELCCLRFLFFFFSPKEKNFCRAGFFPPAKNNVINKKNPKLRVLEGIRRKKTPGAQVAWIINNCKKCVLVRLTQAFNFFVFVNLKWDEPIFFMQMVSPFFGGM